MDIRIFENDQFDLTHQGAILWWNLGLLIAPIGMAVLAFRNDGIQNNELMWIAIVGTPPILIVLGAVLIRSHPGFGSVFIMISLLPAGIMQAVWILLGFVTLITAPLGILGMICCNYIMTAMDKELNGVPVRQTQNPPS